MLRLLRIIGIIVFAVLVGYSANSLWKMHENGELFEKYNSSRKAHVTLLGFSVVILAGLGAFEVFRVRRGSESGRLGNRSYSREMEEKVSGLDSTSIYAAPESLDEWKGRRTHSSRTKKKDQGAAGSVWMRMLRALCMVLPLFYLALLILNILVEHEEELANVMLPVVFGIFLVLSIIALIGVRTKKTWGMSVGYMLAVCNLLIFPYGTAVGLFLMIGLVGASPIFQESAAANKKNSRHHRAARARARAKMRASAI